MKGRIEKPSSTHCTSKLGELLSPRRRIVGEGNLRFPPPAGKRGLPPKIWRRRCLSKGRKLHQGALPRRASSPHRALNWASPPPSCKLMINKKLLLFPLRTITRICFCSPGSSSSQQGSSSGDLLPKMMESETPPHATPPHEAGDPEVSSRRVSPDPPRPEGNTLATRSPQYSAPKESNKKVRNHPVCDRTQ